MSARTTSLIVVTLIGVAFAVFLLTKPFEAPPDTNKSLDAEQRDSANIDAAVLPEVEQAKTDAEESSLARSGEVTAPDRDDDGHDLELYFIRGSALDATRLMTEMEKAETFEHLVRQLREQANSGAAEERMAQELLFYSEPLAQDGSVTLDALECGARLCASQLRANDQSTLDRFIASLTQSGKLDTQAVIQLRAEPLPGAGNGETRRLIFSHDPAITGIALPREALHVGN